MTQQPLPGSSENRQQGRSDFPAPLFPVAYSLFSSEALGSFVQTTYFIDQLTDCHVRYIGVNDTYLVSTTTSQYILRVYRAGWRTFPAIQYELDLLTYLVQHGINVAMPIPRRDGTLIGALHAPEGIRHVVLFTYAPGTSPTPGPTQSYHFGRALAQVHSVATSFVSHARHHRLDLTYLIDDPLADIYQVLKHRPADWDYVQSVASQLRMQLQEREAMGLMMGVCHGDVQWKNIHMAPDDHQVTFFDFDDSGPGWLAYDLAIFRCAAVLEHRDESIWKSFLQGYTSVHQLNDNDLAAIPIFVAIIRIHSMGFFAHHRDTTLWGSDALYEGYFDREITFLQSWRTKEDQ